MTNDQVILAAPRSSHGRLEQLAALGGVNSSALACTGLFTLRGNIIHYSGFDRIVSELARVHRRGVVAGAAESMQILGQTGCGKSTLLKWYCKQFPPYEVEGEKVVPVLYVETPEAPTVKSLAAEVLRAMGDSFHNKGSADEKTERIIHLCRELKVELILLDEIQHFIDSGKKAELARLTDWLKRLINALERPVVLAGLPKSLLVTRSNPQLRRRFSAPLQLEPLGYETKAQQAEFRGVLQAFWKSMPAGSIDISQHETAQRMYYATAGLMDYIVKILDDAVSRGGSGSGGVVTIFDLAKSFRRAVWGGAPEGLNPFLSEATLRFLNRPGEPFEVWDPIERYRGGRAKTGEL